MIPVPDLAELTERIAGAREAATREGTLDPYVISLAAMANMVCEYLTASDVAWENCPDAYAYEAAIRRVALTGDRLRHAVGMPLSRRRITSALARLGAENEPPPGWQDAVLATLPRPELREPWYRRALRWIGWS